MGRYMYNRNCVWDKEFNRLGGEYCSEVDLDDQLRPQGNLFIRLGCIKQSIKYALQL